MTRTGITRSTIGACLAALSMLITSAGALAAPPAMPTNFADPAFEKVWTRTDAPVESGRVSRSWFWGPKPNTGPLSEDYQQGPGGKHMVQYFDKSRMEVNNPNGDRSNPFFVTNGLLTTELVTGKMQVGDNAFVLRWPAEIPVAGDPGSTGAPTYAAFRGAVDRVDRNTTGSVITATINSNGGLDFVHGGPGFGNYDRFGVKNAYFEQATAHNIPDVFWTFLNATGPVVVDGRQTTARLNQPYFYATGYPISDAYWTQVPIKGIVTPVLIQAYQRRVLTYVPSNPAGFKVEMGNVGQHYYDWRYNDAGKPPALAGTCSQGYPALGFGKLYNDNLQVKIELGCQQGPEMPYSVTSQTFERGQAIGVKRYDFYRGSNYEDVFVLYNNGKAQTFGYNPEFTGPEPPGENPPPGLYSATGNFGVVLRANPTVYRDLGWATAPAHVEGTQAPGGKVTGGVPVQFFDGGLMVYPDLAARKIFVLYNSSGYASDIRGPHLTLVDINRWSVYDDTFGG